MDMEKYIEKIYKLVTCASMSLLVIMMLLSVLLGTVLAVVVYTTLR